MTADRRNTLGRRGEQIAASHLEQSGWRIVARNYRVREGEIDLIAARGATLAFCEVKALVARTRGPSAGPVEPLEAIGPAKRLQVRRLARLWLAERAGAGRPTYRDLRFDAIGVLLSPAGELLRLEHVEAAF